MQSYEVLQQQAKETAKAYPLTAAILAGMAPIPLAMAPFHRIRQYSMSQQRNALHPDTPPSKPASFRSGFIASGGQLALRVGLRTAGLPFINQYINNKFKENNTQTCLGFTLSKKDAAQYVTLLYFLFTDFVNISERISFQNSDKQPNEPSFSACLKKSYVRGGIIGAMGFTTHGMLPIVVLARQLPMWGISLQVNKHLQDALPNAPTMQAFLSTASGIPLCMLMTPISAVQRIMQGPEHFPPLSIQKATTLFIKEIKKSKTPLDTAYAGFWPRVGVYSVSAFTTLFAANLQKHVQEYTQEPSPPTPLPANSNIPASLAAPTATSLNPHEQKQNRN